MNWIYGTPGQCVEGGSFLEMAQQRGIIFMYELVTDQTQNQITY
jgi:hypothetical protein